jgi:hypothetical protein
MENWDESLKKGKRNEEFFIENIKNLCIEHGLFLVDVTTEKQWKGLDVDLLFIDIKTNNYKKLELKSGSDEGSICVEIKDNIEENHKGWFYTSRTDIMTWISNSYIISVNWTKLKHWLEDSVRNNKNGLYLRRFKNKSYKYNIVTSLCFWVDVKKMLDDCINMPFLLQITDVKNNKPDNLVDLINIIKLS